MNVLLGEELNREAQKHNKKDSCMIYMTLEDGETMKSKVAGDPNAILHCIVTLVREIEKNDKDISFDELISIQKKIYENLSLARDEIVYH